MTHDPNPVALQRIVAEQAALRRVATMVAQDVPASTLFDHVCRELGGVLDVKSTDIVRFDDDGQATIVGAWARDGGPSFPVGERIPIEAETVTGKIYETGRPQRIDDYEGVPGELARRLREAGVRSVVGAPVVLAGRFWGGIMATSAEPAAFPAEAEQRIADFAELVTAALANADAREELAASRARLVAAGDEARRRIERDLHDGAQQRLVSLALKLQLLQGSVDKDSAIGRELATVRSELDETLDELRELARGIHPSVLTERGLVAAVEALAKRAPMPVAITAHGDLGELAMPLQTTAYFVIAEALTNCAKHSGCERATVEIAVDDEHLNVEVSDDGTGGANIELGSGLRGLAERVQALDGTLAIESERGAGTVLRARIPLCSCELLAEEAEDPVAGAAAG